MGHLVGCVDLVGQHELVAAGAGAVQGELLHHRHRLAHGKLDHLRGGARGDAAVGARRAGGRLGHLRSHRAERAIVVEHLRALHDHILAHRDHRGRRAEEVHDLEVGLAQDVHCVGRAPLVITGIGVLERRVLVRHFVAELDRVGAGLSAVDGEFGTHCLRHAQVQEYLLRHALRGDRAVGRRHRGDGVRGCHRAHGTVVVENSLHHNRSVLAHVDLAGAGRPEVDLLEVRVVFYWVAFRLANGRVVVDDPVSRPASLSVGRDLGVTRSQDRRTARGSAVLVGMGYRVAVGRRS